MPSPVGPPGFGFQGYIQYKRENPWGTYIAPTKRVPFYSCNVKPMVDRAEPVFLDGTLANSPIITGAQWVEVDISLPLSYSNHDLIWDFIMGTATYGSDGGVISGGPTPYTKTWSAFQAFLNSFAMEVVRGNIPTGKCERVTGLKVMTATLKCVASENAADMIMKLDLKLVGKQDLNNQTPTVVSTQGQLLDWINFTHMTVMTDAAQVSTAAITRDWELQIDTKAKKRIFLEGSGFISEPQRAGKPSATLTVTREFQSKSALDAFINNSTGYVESKFQLSALANIDIIFYGALKSTPEAPMSNDGWIEQKLIWRNQDGGAQDTLQVVIQNLVSTIA